MLTQRISGLIVVGLLLAACSTPPTPDPNVLLPTQRPLDTPMPTLEVPVFQAADTRITADNASQLSYLGRLSTAASQPSSVFDHAISLDGTRMVALNNELLIVYDLINGVSRLTQGRSEATRVFYAADKSEVYALGGSGTVRIIDADSGAGLNSLKAGVDYNGSAAFYEDAGWLAMGSSSGNIQVWDTVNRTSQVTFSAHASNITALAFNRDGTRLLSAAAGTVTLWDWATRTRVADFSTSDQNVLAVQFAPDGTRFSLATSEYVETYAITDQRFLYTLAVGSSGTSDVFGYSPDGRYLLTGGTPDANITVLYAADGSIAAELPQTSGGRTSARFSPDSGLLVTTVLDGYVTLWNLSQATENSLPSARLLVGSTRITGSEWSQDGFTLTFFDAPGLIYVWGIRQ